MGSQKADRTCVMRGQELQNCLDEVLPDAGMRCSGGGGGGLCGGGGGGVGYYGGGGGGG